MSDGGAAERPRFDELSFVPGTEIRCAWGLWGADDQLGALNLVTEEVTQAALASAQTGQSFPLQLPLDLPAPPLFGRQPMERHVQVDSGSIDDRLDGFYPQASSQWDALGHAVHPDVGLYNGVSVDEVVERGRLGIDNVAARGIVTRGVLLDIPRFHEATGAAWSANERREIEPAMLLDAAAWAGVELREGDVLCIRTGWTEYYKGLTDEARKGLAADSLRLAFSCPGLAPADGIAELVWQTGVVAVAMDNPGVEPFMPPMLPDGSGVAPDDLVHIRLTVALGVMLGEMWDLDGLAAACASDGRYEFLLVSAPLYVRGGVGSPPNAIAIR